MILWFYLINNQILYVQVAMTELKAYILKWHPNWFALSPMVRMIRSLIYIYIYLIWDKLQWNYNN